MEEVRRALGADGDGLSAAEAAERLREHGPNELEGKRKRTILGIFLGQFKDLMILVLLAAAVVAGAVGDLSDATIILAIVLINAVIGVVQEYRAEKALEALQRMAAPHAHVRRDGRLQDIAAREVVPGDTVVLEAGQVVPADLRFTAVHGLRMQEAALTGESMDTAKHPDELEGDDLPLGDRVNMGYKGTVVVKGRGEGVVVATGMRTEMGRIASLLDQGTGATPLQKRMAAFGKVVALAVLVICAALFGLGWWRGGDVMTLLLTSISLAVAAIPEALPALMSVSLALSARRMVKQQALVRRLAAVETLGSVTVICTDKTGTLTRNRMQVEHLVVLDEARRPLLLQALALSNDVKAGPDGEAIGQGTEVALYEHAREQGVLKAEAAKELPRVAELPFDAVRKCMSTIHRRPV
ncbi:MAG: HAD-IC family P-type ATPase, partial [Flavobacteriales bacterium]|nr:HAD-IC family P-type ATPase [Flavobacteriales bacterium]